MAVQRTKTIKNKHAASKSSSGASKSSGGGGKRSPSSDGLSRPRKSSSAAKKGPVVSQQVKEKNRLLGLLKRPKKKVYSEKELGIPALNMVTPVGVEKPKGQKKGKVFVDDKESMSTILSLVQAEKEGHIESKMIKARQMEEIREARKLEAEKKAEEKQAKLEDTKDSLRKKRKRNSHSSNNAKKEEHSVRSIAAAGTRAGKGRKRVAFA